MSKVALLKFERFTPAIGFKDRLPTLFCADILVVHRAKAIKKSIFFMLLSVKLIILVAFIIERGGKNTKSFGNSNIMDEKFDNEAVPIVLTQPHFLDYKCSLIS
jgi:hypothetical protein